MGVQITGGDKLRAHLRKMRENLAEAKEVEVGFFPEDIHPKNHIPVAAVAAMNEYGDPANEFEGHSAPIPPRPFFRYAIAINRPQWNSAFAASMRAVGYHSQAALDGMGALIQGQVRTSIETWSSPMNSPTTVHLKGFNDPLMETGFLVDHVRYKVQT